jgi:arylsulfatase A-like enzyme
MITRMDRDIGVIMDKLKSLGLDRDTVVFFSSDNGPHREGGGDPDFFDSNGLLRGIKRDLYEGGIRVPFIVRWPGKIKPGTTSEHISAFWDFLPTACDIAGVKKPDGIDGISCLPSLTGRGTQRAHEYLYWEFHEGPGTKQAVRRGKWKGVRNLPSAPIELYDLETDIGEERDIAADYPEEVKRVDGIIRSARSDSPHWDVYEQGK